MKRALAIAAGWLACALAAHTQPADAPAETRPFRSVAGGEFTLEFETPLDSLSTEVGPTPVACSLDASRKRASCKVPTTLGPGLWPVDSEYSVGGQYFSGRLIIELRVPAVVSVTPRFVRPGAMIELELEAPLPTGEPVELLIRGEGFERAAKPQLVRAARLRAQLPGGDLPEVPVLQLRVRDMESGPFTGLVVNRWVNLAISYSRLIAPGLLIAGIAALAVILMQPPKRRGS